MTSSFDDLPPRSGRPRQTEEPDPSQPDASRVSEDALWAPDATASDGTITRSALDAEGMPIAAFAPDTEDFALDEDSFEPSEEELQAHHRARGQRAKRVFWEVGQTLVLAAVIFLMVRGVAQNFRVEGPSMEPGLHDGQYLLVNKAVYFKLDLGTLSKYIPFIGDDGSKFLFHGPERGDVIVFRYPRDPSRDFIKRVIAVPGDTVSIHDGQVSVNGKLIEENYLDESTRGNLDDTVVPDGSYFVLGDNRSNSSDSRSWGFVPEENIIGKAMFSYWPLDDVGGVGNHSIDLGFIKVPLP